MDLRPTNPGELRQQIQLQQPPTTGQDSFGALPATNDSDWTTVATVWAKISTMTGRELYQAQRIAAEASHKVIIRYYPGVSDSWRVLFGTRKFDINAVLNLDERNAEMHLLCKESL